MRTHTPLTHSSSANSNDKKIAIERKCRREKFKRGFGKVKWFQMQMTLLLVVKLEKQLYCCSSNFLTGFYVQFHDKSNFCQLI